MLSPKLIKILKINETSPEVLEFFNSVFQEVIKYRETNDLNRNDVAQTLMQARKELVLSNNDLNSQGKNTINEDVLR